MICGQAGIGAHTGSVKQLFRFPSNNSYATNAWGYATDILLWTCSVSILIDEMENASESWGRKKRSQINDAQVFFAGYSLN